MLNKSFFVYFITNTYNSTFYIGVTNDIHRRIYEHKNGLIESFSKKYKLHKLIYLEEFTDVRDALEREKQLKNWHRDWKINLIRSKNPEFKDLLEESV